ncbi:hypothetical protein IHE61_06120 [Streptomyces sp. GKU 257-1]|nr:hypothetical protein [Streptomyces sp. GKU 257-1]
MPLERNAAGRAAAAVRPRTGAGRPGFRSTRAGGRSRTGSAGVVEQIQPGADPVRGLGQRVVAQLRRRQLQGERHAVQPGAQPRGQPLFGDLAQRSADRLGALSEEGDGLGTGCQRRYGQHGLADGTQRLPAGGQHGQMRAGGQQFADQMAAGGDEVLARVEDEQHGAVRDPAAQGVQRHPGRVVGEAERVGHGGGEEFVAPQRPQVGPVDAPGSGRCGAQRVQGEPGLPPLRRRRRGSPVAAP